MDKLEIFDNWPSPTKTRTLLVVGLILAIFFNVITARQLGLAKYPDTELIGPYPAWWFTFNGPELKSHYAILIEQGTMDIFQVVQYLDFGLMVSTGLFLFMLALIVARQHKTGSFFRNNGYITALILVAAPIMDLIENVVLLLMLSNPLEFPDWLAIVYSGFASAKVILVSIGLVFLLVVAIAIVVSKLTSRFVKGKVA